MRLSRTLFLGLILGLSLSIASAGNPGKHRQGDQSKGQKPSHQPQAKLSVEELIQNLKLENEKSRHEALRRLEVELPKSEEPSQYYSELTQILITWLAFPGRQAREAVRALGELGRNPANKEGSLVSRSLEAFNHIVEIESPQTFKVLADIADWLIRGSPEVSPEVQEAFYSKGMRALTQEIEDPKSQIPRKEKTHAKQVLLSLKQRLTGTNQPVQEGTLGSGAIESSGKIEEEAPDEIGGDDLQESLGGLDTPLPAMGGLNDSLSEIPSNPLFDRPPAQAPSLPSPSLGALGAESSLQSGFEGSQLPSSSVDLRPPEGVHSEELSPSVSSKIHSDESKPLAPRNELFPTPEPPPAASASKKEGSHGSIESVPAKPGMRAESILERLGPLEKIGSIPESDLGFMNCGGWFKNTIASKGSGRVMGGRGKNMVDVACQVAYGVSRKSCADAAKVNCRQMDCPWRDNRSAYVFEEFDEKHCIRPGDGPVEKELNAINGRVQYGPAECKWTCQK